MNFLSSLKVIAIKLADKIDRNRDPFDDFTRPALPKETKKLYEFEKEFFDDLNGNFWRCNNSVLVHRIPLDVWGPDPKKELSTLDLGDQALWHGIYTAMLCMRYKLTGKGEDLLIRAAQGLLLHQTAHGEKEPRLIRGVSDDIKTWQDDCSNDSATGHLFGMYSLFKWGPESVQPMCKMLASGLATEILTHSHALVNLSGRPTTYGALEQGWKTDPLRISLALAIYATASAITKSNHFEKAYLDLVRRYRNLACYAKVKFWGLDNYNDTHRAAIHLMILADLTGDASYKEGLSRLRQMVAKDGNVWVNALCGSSDGQEDRNQAMKVLSEFTLSDKQYNAGLDNSETQYFTVKGYGFHRILSQGTWMANQPLPRWAVRSQEFFWQRNLRSLDVGSHGAIADSRLNGGDWLSAYWASRMSRSITAND